MTMTLFISLFTLGSAVSALLTEAIKRAYQNANMKYSPNIVALVNAMVVGGFGTAVANMLLGIPMTTNNILCMFLMVIVVWMASMIGYDKVIQLLNQLKDVTPKEVKEDGNNDNGSTEE